MGLLTFGTGWNTVPVLVEQRSTNKRRGEDTESGNCGDTGAQKAGVEVELHRQCPNYKDSRWGKCVSDIDHDWDGETTSSPTYSRIYKFSCVYDPAQLVTKHLTPFSDVWGHPKHDFTSSTRRSWYILIYIQSEQHPVIADANVKSSDGQGTQFVGAHRRFGFVLHSGA